MKLKEIHRTSTFAWSPLPSLPLLATGTAAGALDASFSNESLLEIWAPNFLDKDEYDLGMEGQHGPRGVITDTSRRVLCIRVNLSRSLTSFPYRFHRLAWANADQTRPEGVIAAGMENGELVLWDPAKIVAGAE